MTPATPSPATPSSVAVAGMSGQANGAAVIALTVELSAEQLDVIATLVAARLGDRPGPALPTWLDARGAADYMACPVSRIHDLVQLQKLSPRRDGRRLLFRRDDLDRYLEGAA